MSVYNFLSTLGIGTLIFLAWLFSSNRKDINWKLVGWGLLFQCIFAYFVFQARVGFTVFTFINSIVNKLLSFAKEGMYFLFGILSLPPGEVGPEGEKSLGFILAFQALPTIVFFSALMSLAYYFRIMPVVVSLFARIFAKRMKISGAESLCAASNIFVGIESAFTIRPYIEGVTNSELCTILTAGMATVASSVLGIYVVMLKQQFPMIAAHLVSASVLSAPAAIIFSKILYPETGKPRTLGKVVMGEYSSSYSWIEAIVKGANEGLKLIGGIVALLLAFLGIISMLNWGLVKLGEMIDTLWNIKINLSIQNLLSYIFYPLCFCMGVPVRDIPTVATLLGERAIFTEVYSYKQLAYLISTNILTNPRSVVIATYALCGFTHIASLAIFVGGIASLVPGRTKDLAQVGFRAFVAATFACILTGAIAGMFYTGKVAILFSK